MEKTASLIYFSEKELKYVKSEFSIGTYSERNYTTSISAVYKINADSSYQVTHQALPTGEYVLIYVTGGSGVLKLTEEILLEKGNIYLFDGNTDFSYYTAENSWDFWWFEFSADIVPLPINQNINIQGDIFLNMLCDKILSLHLQLEYNTASALLSSFLAYASSIFKLSDDINSSQALLFSSQSFIRKNLLDVTVQKTADKFFISTRSLNNLYNKHLGMSPKQYILNQKIEKGEYYLRSTNKNIDDIAMSLGFSSGFHFSKCFKNRNGISPTAYRKNNSLAEN